MRNALPKLDPPDHVGLAYEAWAPVGKDDGKVPDGARADWLKRLADTKISPDYAAAFKHWETSFQPPADETAKVTFQSRLLVGHGNPSGVDVGLTLHRTWGVPIIPGSALKGLCAHYLAATYGPGDGEQGERENFRGVVHDDRGRPVRSPGAAYQALFGAPDVDGGGAAAGTIVFHDALYVPGSAKDDKPFAVDVLTVHQKNYYNEAGKKSWPNDYDSPNPVAFLSVRPGVKLLLALSGPPEWTALAKKLLEEALRDWGAGGKTSSGYGRISGNTGGPAAPRAAPPKVHEQVEAVLLEKRTNKGGWKAWHEPSGLAGAIQNTAEVPAASKPGDHVILVVVSVNPKKVVDFRYVASKGA